MQAESSKPSMPISTDMSAVEGESQVRVKSNRCPYCHDDVEPAGSVVCQDCLTRHHPECWDEGHHCSSCSSPNKLVSNSEPQTISVERKSGQSSNWDDFGRPDLEVQESRSVQRNRAAGERHPWGDAANRTVPPALKCSIEDCKRMGAMYSAYSEDRLCPDHAREHDRIIWRTKALIFSIMILLGISLSFFSVLLSILATTGLCIFFVVFFSGSRS